MMTDAKCNFGIYGSLILSTITLDSPTIFIATITDSPTVTKAVKTANLDEYLLISGIVLVAIGLVVLSVCLWKVKAAKARYKVDRNNQTNRQRTNI